MQFRLGVLIGLLAGSLLAILYYQRKEARIAAKMNQRTAELNKGLAAIKQDREDDKRVGRLIK